MGVYENTAVDDKVDTDAEFQAWCQAYEAALLASGFLEVAPDTGQLDLTSVVRPAINTYAGYRMYRAKDDLAATKPLYAKVEYGVSATQTRPTVRRTLATGSNGAGSLTGPVSSVITLLSPGSEGSGAATILGGGGPNSVFVAHIDPGNVGFQAVWALGRVIDPDDGSPGSDISAWDTSVSSGTAYASSLYATDGAAAWSQSNLTQYFPDMSAALQWGGDVNTTLLFQAQIYRQAKVFTLPVVLGRGVELPWTNVAGSKFSMLVWGGIHTLLPLPLNALNTSGRFCFIWE